MHVSKIALITDTTSDTPEDIINKYDIKVLPFRIIYKDREYKDKFEITPDQVYDNLKNEIPTSSLPSMQDMEEMFTKLEAEGYTHAVAILLSSGLSGIYNAMKLVSENHPDITTFLLDSKSLSVGEYILVKKCGEMIESGKTFEEIVDTLPLIQKKVHLYFVVETLEYLRKGGRIGRVAGTIGDLLNIKPVISIDEDGRYYTFDKVRGRKQSLNRLIEIAKERLSTSACSIYMMEGRAHEEAKKVHETLSVLPNVTSIFFGGDISPVAGAHSGPGLIGMAIIEEN
jgi:DegV family protein with EDD domain